ncbi:helix-turn-helix domain-containing protein [Sansalvadorimonas verongulae]|uniref:helix-turn-helix domain-containing protein n=1 Tax=Sansalvadorimonas verongulae TaxID=2172824 RepID=UPI0018AD1C99|nr:helix-turn-helix domain-containing protein [Sansalvadorimonas verongulae]
MLKVTDEDLDGLPGPERWMLVVMASLCDSKTGTHYWSQKRIAAKAGVSLATAGRQIKSLASKGYITVISGKEQSASNIYKVNLDPVIRNKAREAYAKGETYPEMKPKDTRAWATDIIMDFE